MHTADPFFPSPISFNLPNLPTSHRLRGIAACLLILAASCIAGCKQQEALNIAQEVVNWTPALTSAVGTIDSTAALLLPVEAPIFIAATAGFDAAAGLVTSYAKAYLANPSSSILVNLQTAIVTLEQSVNAGVLQAVAIKDSNSQKAALSAINGLGTIVLTILALVQSISTKAQLDSMQGQVKVTLARVRPLMDTQKMQAAAERYPGATVNGFFSYEAAHGF
jgi:hypothetical protein